MTATSTNYNRILELWDQKYNTAEIAKLLMVKEHMIERSLHEQLELRRAAKRIRDKFNTPS